LTVGIILQLFSYIPYAAAFVPPEVDSEPAIDMGLIAIALLTAPLVFVSVGLISRRSGLLRRVLQSMGLLVGLGLVLGLLTPVVGAAAGFGVGFAFTLHMPDFDGQLRRRLVGVGFVVVYMSVMLVLIPAAGVLAGAILPGFMVGFADEYGAWQTRRRLQTRA